jgi:hypothetical protein
LLGGSAAARERLKDQYQARQRTWASYGDYDRRQFERQCQAWKVSSLLGGPVGFHSVPFSAANISGQNVFESREHFEANNDPGSWGLTRFWVSNRDLLINWLTENSFADGTYYLTVHTCTAEPDTAFVSVPINGQPAEACANVDASEGGTLDIDFIAHDPDGHLAYYTLQATYGNNLAVNLLEAPGATLSPAPPVGAVPSAAQVVPTYGAALTLPQTAVARTWAGGSNPAAHSGPADRLPGNVLLPA